MTDTTPIAKLLYTPNEAAQALGISRSSLYVLLAQGTITSVRIGTSRRVPATALTEYVEALTRHGGKVNSTSRSPSTAGAVASNHPSK